MPAAKQHADAQLPAGQQTLYGQHGEVVESRTEVPPATGQTSFHWLVSRTIYDSQGRVAISTDRFLVPGDTPLGEDPAGGPVPTQITETIYDDRGRTVATERYTGATVSLTQDAELDYSPRPVVTDSGTLESVSETLYDDAGRVWRTISGRVPLSTLSDTALTQAQALANYPTHGDQPDPYNDLQPTVYSLSPGTITDTIFDGRGRQYASLGHPLPAADIGLTGANYDGNLARTRSEIIYDSHGRASLQRSGLAHVETSTGTLVGVYDQQSVDTKTFSDAVGNVYRTEFISGGTLTYDAAQERTTRTGGELHSYTLTRFDEENRPIAEMQQTAGTVTGVWSETENSFVIDGASTAIPTKLYEYDADDRLAAVELPAVANPLNSDAVERPRYEYAYDEQGNQTLIVDPLGNETRFTFTERGGQATRTLPLGFGPDGEQGTGDDATLPEGDFTERMEYDDRGRQTIHVSFEGIVSENVYDAYGRLSGTNFYAKGDYDTARISEHHQYVYDEEGRRAAVYFRTPTTPSGGADPLSFPVTRAEQTIYDDRGRIVAEVSEEGVLGYGYDSLGRMTHTAIYKTEADYDSGTADRLTHYGYDLLGRLVSVKEDATPIDLSDDVNRTATDYTFDLAGRMDTQTTVGDSAASVTTDYDYDALGRLDLQSDTDENGNTLTRYDYTVRADGKRTGLEEAFWITDDNDDGVVDATDGDGIQQEEELDKTTYGWTYDSVGRLTDEVLDHWDNNFDQTESFTYDLTGNRVGLERDLDNNGTIEESIEYRYDANDRLFAELSDSASDTTTIYQYDHTQQSDKTLYTTLLDEATINSLADGGDDSGLQRVSAQRFAYNLQGRMSAVVNEGYTSGTLSSHERTSYEYDSKSFRVRRVHEVDTTLDLQSPAYSLQSATEFLADHHNHTGYTQTIRETRVENGNTLTVDYTFGQDEIAQRVISDDGQGTVTEATHIFGHDGHGSVRVIYDLAATIAQVFTFAAYGQLLAVHGSDGVAVSGSAALTSLGYSGEHFDAKMQQQYLRARWYDAANGRFNRLDPFAGNAQDSQSLHKYAYVHGDPIQGTDPTGLFAAISISISTGFSSQTRATSQSTNIGVLNSAKNFASFASRAYRLANNAYDGINAILTAIDLVTFDPTDLLEITKVLPRFKSFIGGLGNLSAAGTAPNVPNRLIDSRPINLNLKFRGKLDKMFRIVTALPRATERIGEFGAALIAKQLGFQPTELKYSNTGIDAVLYNEQLDTFMVLEAKGSNQARRLGKLSRGQFDHSWIRDRLNKLIRSNLAIPGTAAEDAQQLQTAIRGNKPVVASVASLNIRAGKMRFGVQLYQDLNSGGFKRWRGF